MNDDIINSIKDGIAKVESGGKYTALGPVTKKGDRAYGKYQIMGNNIPSWTKEALGKSYTPDDFMKDTDAQEKVASYKMGQYYKKYGNAQDVASTWFTGGPLKTGAGKKDILGTTTEDYVRKSTGGLLPSLLGVKTANAQTMNNQQLMQPSQQPTQPKQLSRDQLIANIDALEKQGAGKQEVQGYLDSLKGGTQSGRKPFSEGSVQPTAIQPNTNLEKFGDGLGKVGTSQTGQGLKEMAGATLGGIKNGAQGTIQGIANATGVPSLVASGANLVKGVGGLFSDKLWQSHKDSEKNGVDLGYFGKVKPMSTPGDALKTGIQAGTTFAGGGSLFKSLFAAKAIPAAAVTAMGGKQMVSKMNPVQLMDELIKLKQGGKIDPSVIMDIEKVLPSVMRKAGYAPSLIRQALSKLMGKGWSTTKNVSKLAIPVATYAAGSQVNRRE